MEKKFAFSGDTAKRLSTIAVSCFQEVVGDRPNHQFKYHSSQEIQFIMNSINTMVDNYLVETENLPSGTVIVKIDSAFLAAVGDEKP